MRRPRVALALALAAAFAPAAALAVPEPEPPTSPRPDPVPLRRTLIPATRVAAELERAKQGALVQMPREEFEARVQRAAGAAAAQPRLVRATYTARLHGPSLVGGGDWGIDNPGAVAAILPLNDFNLALRKITSEEPAALVAAAPFDGKALGLLVPRPGKQSVFFDWSLAGSASGDDLQFALQVPACPLAALELTLPDDHVVLAPGGGALVGPPGRAADAGHRLWRIEFGGQSRLDVVIRRPPGPGRPAALLCQVQTAQQLTPVQMLARYEFQLEALGKPVRELNFDCDAGLEPYDILASKIDLESWEIRDGPRGGRTLTVRLREPFLGPERLTVLARAALPLGPAAGSAWVSPGVRPRGAVHRGEGLTIQTGGDVRLEGLRPGGFRVVSASASPDGGQTVALADGPGAATGARPSGWVRPPSTDALARQLTWWQVGPNGSSLTAEVTYEVTRGSLHRLLLAIPTGYRVEGLSVEPPDLLRDWSPPSKGSPALTVELARGLTAGSRATVTARLWGAAGRGVKAPGSVLPFPDVEPLDCQTRQGALAVSVDPFYQAAVPQATHAASGAPAGPWGQSYPNFYYPYQGKSPVGKLRVLPHRTRVRARCAVDAYFAGGRASVTARLELAPAAGSPESIDLLVSAPVARWRWRPGVLADVRRLPGVGAAPGLLALGQREPLAAAALLAATPPGELWRLTLAAPLARRETVTLEADLEPEGDPSRPRWRVPLITVPGAEPMEGEATLHLLGTEAVGVEAAGARDTGREPPRGRASGPDSWRMYHYGDAVPGGLHPSLAVTTRTLVADGTAREGCDRARLTTYVEPNGRLLHHLTFEVDHWRRHRLPVLLPAGAQLLAARVEGRALGGVPQADGPAGLTVELPAPAAAGPHRFEVVYTTASDWPTWAPWARLDAPTPQLPMAPTSFRRTWRLPPGLSPLGTGVRRLPDSSAPAALPWWGRAEAAWRDGRRWLALLGPELASEDWLPAQRQLIAGADDALKRLLPPGKGNTLGDAVDRLALEHFQRQGTLAVDQKALREARLWPGTPLPAGRLGELGLVLVPAADCPVLTTRRRADGWPGGSAPPRLAQAVAEARANGQDASGRFVLAAHWLSGTSGPAPAEAEGLPWLDSYGHAWGEWEAVPGAGDSLVVVRESAAAAAGAGAAGLLLLAAWWTRRTLSLRWRFRLLMLWLTGAGLALFWAPPGLLDAAWWPALAAAAVALAWYVRAAFPPPESPDPSRPRSTHKATRVAAAAGASALALALAAVGTGQPPAPQEPYPVLILAGPADAPDRQSVLVGPDLLRRLDELARRAEPAPRGAALLSVSYSGEIVGDRADLVAEFQVWCPAEGAAVAVPLSGVDLREGALWAGARAHPVATPEGYSVPLRRGGAQAVNTLRIPFSVRLSAAGDGRELRFRAPALPASKLRLTLPKGAVSVTTTAIGTSAVRGAPAGVSLEADLGRAATVAVRWRPVGAAARPPSLAVREAYLWDLRAGTLSAALEYAVSGGPVSRLEVTLPPATVVRSVEVSATAPASGGRQPPDGLKNQGADAPRSPGEVPGQAPRLKRWEVLGPEGDRRLRVELDPPARGGVRLALALLPPMPSGPGPARLRLPAPVDASSGEGVVAFRTDGLDAVDRLTGLAGQPLGPEAFATAAEGMGLRGAPRPTRAYVFRRGKGVGALEVALASPVPLARQETVWRVHAQHADFEAEAKLTATGSDLGLVEWEVPAGVTVASVNGPQVRAWTRHDGRVQAWLAPGSREASVRVQGWSALPKGKGAKGRFVLPALRLLTAAASPNVVRVASPPELQVEPDLTRPWQDLERVPGPGLSYSAGPGPYRGEFLLSPAPVVPQASCLTVAEVRDGALTFAGYVDYHVPHGELRTAKVKLSGWAGEAVRIEAPGAKVREAPAGPGERSWVLTLPPGVARHYAVRLSGSAPLRAGANPTMPEVRAAEAEVTRRWLAVAGPALRGEAQRGLAPAGEAALRPWPAEAERVRRAGGAWEVRRDDWSLRLTVQPGGSAAVRVLLAEYESAVVDLRRWTHQVTWRLYGGGPEVRVALPPGARLLAAAVDGEPAAVRPADAGQVALLLPGTEGPHVVRLRWSFDSEETLERPNLAPPRLEGGTEGPAIWQVDLPPGYHLASGGRQPPDASTHQGADAHRSPVRASAAALEVARAEAQLRLSELLAERLRMAQPAGTREPLLAAQREFFRHARAAARHLATEEDSPDGQTLAARLADLRRQNGKLGQAAGLSQLQQDAERQSRSPGAEGPFALPDLGLPRYWYAATDGAPPSVRLFPAEDRRVEAALASASLLLGLIAVAIISLLPRVRRWAVALLPEVTVLLGWLGWQAFGPSAWGVVLMVAGVSLRLGLLAAWLQRRLRRPAPTVHGSSYTPA